MSTYQNTSIYQESCQQISHILTELHPEHTKLTVSAINAKLLVLTSQLAEALQEDSREQVDQKLFRLEKVINKIIQLVSFAHLHHEISAEKSRKIQNELQAIWQNIHNFPQKRRNILILSSVMGQGHMSASKAIKQGIEELYGKDYNVTIIDFYEVIGEIFNKATVKAYEGATKHAPAFYKYFFESTDSKWPVQLLNIVNYPLNAAKIDKLFRSFNPHLIISAFPVWDYLSSIIIKKLGNIKFISVVTDSISIHHVWVTGNPDFHIVANSETAISLKKLGAPQDKIKVLGFPVKLAFSKPGNRVAFIKNFRLDPENFTIIFLPTAEKTSNTIKSIEEIRKNFPKVNLFVICGRDEELLPKLEHFNHLENTRIIGWTDQMPEFIKNSDLVITKAGGATVMECIAAKKPMIITQVIPGQEMGNAELIKIHELGIIQKSAKMTLSECIKYIQENHSRINKNLATQSKPEAALDIAKFVNEQL